MVGLFVLLVPQQKNIWEIIGFSIFGGSLIIMYIVSTLYHSLTYTRAKTVFRILDQSAIFLLIAGTYTPIVLMQLRSMFGWILLAAIWSFAIFGITMKSIFGNKRNILYICCYVCMGWIGMIMIKPLWEALSMHAVFLLICGGVCYTSGIGFYMWKKLPFHHSIWHLFILGGSIYHFFLMQYL